MQLEIKGLHEQLGITVLYVTHNREAAMVMLDKVCVLNEILIEQAGSLEEMYFSSVPALRQTFSVNPTSWKPASGLRQANASCWTFRAAP